MPRILVVEDSPTQAVQIQVLLDSARFEVELSGHGGEAIRAIEAAPPDLVLTDLDMPEMDGLQLVQRIRAGFPAIPVILMTALGSEDIALQALRSGAASYIPKRLLDGDLVSTVRDVLATAQTQHDYWRLLECLTRSNSHFRLPNDGTLIGPLVSHFQAELNRVQLADEMGVMQITIAINEALDNAIFHGNLELSTTMREHDRNRYRQLADQRCRQLPYKDRYVKVDSSVSAAQFVLSIQDEGPGFDRALLPDHTDPANLDKPGGRGLMLIKTFMDEVHHNDAGNEITLIKNRH